jgi:hypothetical protein
MGWNGVSPVAIGVEEARGAGQVNGSGNRGKEADDGRNQ